MSNPENLVLIVFGVPFVITVAWGWAWVIATVVRSDRPSSITALKTRADASAFWFINPFARRTFAIWRHLTWIAGVAWIAAAWINRISQ